MITQEDVMSSSVRILGNIYDTFIRNLRRSLDDLYGFGNDFRNTNKKKFIMEGSYHFIPRPSLHVLEQLLIAREYHRKYNSKDVSSFLDAGCGIGNILVLARMARLDVFGLELDDNAIEIAKKHIFDVFLEQIYFPSKCPKDLKFTTHKKKKYPIAKQDILKYEGYGWYDILYYYCPFEDHEMEFEFEKRVEDQMKVGAVLMPELKRGTDLRRDERFKPLDKVANLTCKKHGRIQEYACNMFVKIKK